MQDKLSQKLVQHIKDPIYGLFHDSNKKFKNFSCTIMIREVTKEWVKPEDAGSFPSPESQPMKMGGWKVICYNYFKSSESSG